MRNDFLPIMIAFLFLAPSGLVSGQEFEAESYSHEIVFEAYEDDNWDLFVMRADGSDVRNLTNTPGRHELYPQASPDGTRICFLCDDIVDGRTQRGVEVMDRDGADRKRVADDARQPCWSSDSRRIAFVPQEFDRFIVTDYVSKGLKIYEVESGKTREAGNPDIHHLYTLNWSPDGKWIVSTVHGGMGFAHAVIAVEIDGPRVVDLGISGCRPSLDPTGGLITWSSDDHTIQVARLEWSAEGPRLSDAKVLHHEEEMHCYHPDLSPDGKYVVFSLGPGGRVAANGPGTQSQVAEMVGVRGKWNLVRVAVEAPGDLQVLTPGDDQTSKEPEWIVGR